MACVRDVMSREVKTLRRNDKLSIADDLMRAERVRHLPVLDEEGALCGIVSQRDLFRGALAIALGYGETGQRKVMSMLAVKEVMATEVITIGADAPLAEAATRMLEHGVGCLPVVERTALVGILTESDFVRLALSSPPGAS